ncbi:nucleoside hydrolase, partial [Rhizobium ruizarguesonis]
ITPAAEFNIYVDPEAADIVFRSGFPIVMMPLDVTHQLLTRKDRVKRMAEIGTAPAKAMVEMMKSTAWPGCSAIVGSFSSGPSRPVL